MSFDPSPPYTVLRTPQLSFHELEQIRGVGRLLDLLNNSNRYEMFLLVVDLVFSDRVEFYRRLQEWWQQQGLFEEPLGLLPQFEALNQFIDQIGDHLALREALARDFARAGRVVPGKAPLFFNCELTTVEQQQIKQRIKQELDRSAPGEKLQHFAAVFQTLSQPDSRSLVLYLYRSRSGKSPTVEEIVMQS